VQAWADRTERKRSPETVRKLVREASAFWKMVAVRKMDIDLPPNPFVGLRLPKRVDARYRSKIKAGELLKAAIEQLPRPELATVVLALCAGLRRREIDHLTWASVFSDRIEVAPTDEYALKSKASAGAVPLDKVVGEMLAAWKKESLPSAYVVACDEAPRKIGRTIYRSAAVQEKVIAWLRKNGVDATCPLHILRKESGSLVAARAGVWAASAFLRHGSVQVTQAHYIERKAQSSPGFATVIPIEAGKENEASA
jgi:integrase